MLGREEVVVVEKCRLDKTKRQILNGGGRILIDTIFGYHHA